MRNPDAKPATTKMASTAPSGAPRASARNFGAPAIRKAATYTRNRGIRSAQRAAISEPAIDAPLFTAKTRPTTAAPPPVSLAHTGTRTAEKAMSIRLVTATISVRVIRTGSRRRYSQPVRSRVRYGRSPSSSLGHRPRERPGGRHQHRSAQREAGRVDQEGIARSDQRDQAAGERGSGHPGGAFDGRREPGDPLHRHAGLVDDRRGECVLGGVAGTAQSPPASATSASRIGNDSTPAACRTGTRPTTTVLATSQVMATRRAPESGR